MKFLSIIIPHYNLPKELLMRCIDSIIAQKMPDDSYEIIVVDDGSRERPYWVLDTYTDRPIRLIEDEHGGLSCARNKGIDEAIGKYIMFIDSDDCLLPNSINGCIETLHTESPQILRYKHRVCKTEKEILKPNNKKYKTSNTISGASYMAQNNLPGAAWLYFFKKEIIIKHNIRFINGIYHEDEDFTTRLHYYATTLVDSNTVLYNYCTRDNSITTGHNKEIIKKRIYDHLNILKELTTFRSTAITSNELQVRGINRKLATLSVDFIIKLLLSGKSIKETKLLCIKELTPLELYPLPKYNISLKYSIFRKLADCTLGLYILSVLLKLK